MQYAVDSRQKEETAARARRPPVFYCLLPTAYCLLLLLSSGCGPSRAELAADRGVADYFVGDFAGAQRRLAPLAQQTDENYVLNNARLGSAALVEYNLPEAEAAFYRAYEVINSSGVNDAGRAFNAAVVAEKLKIWKGEPYERAMVNFYLGLVYYMRHDYPNARAAFENALFKLRDYGEAKNKDDEYRVVESDFALAYVMLAKCWQRLGDEDKARVNFDRAAQLRRYLAPLADPERNRRSNVLLVVDFGRPPRKLTNYDGAIVGLGPTPEQAGPIPPPTVVVDGRRIDLAGAGRPPVDLLALAQERRWQDIDTIRAVKTTVGTALVGVGAYEGLRSRNQSNQLAGLAIAGAGLLLKASSQADVRQWEMLPRTTFLLPLELPPGPHDVTVDFPDVPGQRQSWRGLVAPPPGGPEATYYFRMLRYRTGPFVWPPAALVGPDGAGAG